MIRIELPYPGGYPKLAGYMKAVKPFLTYWKFLHKDSEFKSPADDWKDHQEMMQEAA